MRFWLFLSVCVLVLSPVEAKYKYPEGVKTAAERALEYDIKKYSTGEKGGLSLEDYKNYKQVRTRDDRRQERRAKKKGTYVSPEDAFKQIDKDGDGIASEEEILEYERARLKK